jgi:hypothetical protein
MKTLLRYKLLKPYSRTQTILGQSGRAYNEDQWEAPDFGRCLGPSGHLLAFQGSINSRCLMTAGPLSLWVVWEAESTSLRAVMIPLFVRLKLENP